MVAMTGPDLDRRLVTLARSGDRVATSRLVERHERGLWTFLARLAGADRADDLFQETWIRALPALGTFRGQSAFRTWLLSIGRRVAADTARRRPVAALESDPGIEDGDPLSSREQSREIADAIRDLTGRQREAVVLRYLEGLAFKDVAAVMGIGEATARKYALEGIRSAGSRMARPVEQ